ncbi:MAG: hypothetical protein LBV53_00190 [Mycoplasmataceae bacterium]|jgi:uncharacterized protein YlzI (FlbEa/FlbD family)|nr:hypothetical protein [Mycoplasmataceae bacterium]
MELIKLTMMWDKGFFKKIYIERTIYVNPQNVDYIWDWTKQDNAKVQTVLHINGKRIYVKENFNDVLNMLTKGGKK